MNRFRMRASVGLAACGLATAALTGCGAGQVSQMATQEPAINGATAQLGPISLRNVHLRATQESAYIQPGTQVELLFAAVNTSPDTDNKLLSVTSDIGDVDLTGDTSLPAKGILLVGEPDGQIAKAESVETADAATAEVALRKPITNGLLYDFTFTFENGESTVAVPISAGEAPRRDKLAEPAPAEGGH